MPKHTSKDLKEKIVEWKKDGYSIHQIIELSGLKRSQVYATLKVHRETGSVQNPYARLRGRKRILTIDDHTFVESTVRTNPSLILPEVQERLNNLRGVSVSTSTLSRTSDRLGLSRKRLAHRASERDPLLRATWIAEHGGYPMSYYLWLDESGIDELTCQRRTGWARKGVAPVQQQTFIRGTKYSVLPVLTSSGIPVMEIVEGSINKDVFINFLKTQVVQHLNPFPGPGSVVILDNCKIHHDEEIRRIIEDENGAKLIYLPPYSPDLNPIEQAFAFLKGWLRRHRDDFTGPDSRPWLIHQASLAVTPRHAAGWIRNSGYE